MGTKTLKMADVPPASRVKQRVKRNLNKSIKKEVARKTGRVGEHVMIS